MTIGLSSAISACRILLIRWGHYCWWRWSRTALWFASEGILAILRLCAWIAWSLLSADISIWSPLRNRILSDRGHSSYMDITKIEWGSSGNLANASLTATSNTCISIVTVTGVWWLAWIAWLDGSTAVTIGGPGWNRILNDRSYSSNIILLCPLLLFWYW